mmetsp:Transcript_38949/g.77896  ORF Transcript_38949/g.77896 Transcript_38949/m.77896 type:complete len:213 (-) Transcript_38949:6-644(-)
MSVPSSVRSMQMAMVSSPSRKCCRGLSACISPLGTHSTRTRTPTWLAKPPASPRPSQAMRVCTRQTRTLRRTSRSPRRLESGWPPRYALPPPLPSPSEVLSASRLRAVHSSTCWGVWHRWTSIGRSGRCFGSMSVACLMITLSPTTAGRWQHGSQGWPSPRPRSSLSAQRRSKGRERPLQPLLPRIMKSSSERCRTTSFHELHPVYPSSTSV